MSHVCLDKEPFAIVERAGRMLAAFAVAILLVLSPTPVFAQGVPKYAGPPSESFLKRWLVLGPIALGDQPLKSNGPAMEEDAQKKAFDADALTSCGGETQIFGTHPPACSVDDHELQWKSIESSSDVVDLGKALGSKDYAVSYALAELDSRAALSVVAALGSDDAVKVWLNGKLVFRNWSLRALAKDQDIALLPLQPGRNQLLLKIHNERLDWSFCLRILGAAGIEKSLWQAAQAGDLEALEMLLGQRVRFRINAKAKHGLTAWQIAKLLGRSDAAALLARHGASTTLPMPKPESIVDSILSEATSGERPGVAVLVMRDGKVLFEKGYGYASLEHGARITPETRFRIGSITKQFTAAAILRLQEQGRLGVNDPLSKYFPNFPRGKQITLHQLLTHTSGIHSFTDRADFRILAATPMDSGDLYDLIRKDPFDFEPGAKFSYSNSGYFLLGEIVAKVSGKPFAEFLKTEFFEPLGMKDTGVHLSEAILPHEATGYVFAGGSVKRPVSWDAATSGGAGSLISTVRDLGRWSQALLAGKALSEASLKTAWTSVSVAATKQASPDSPINERGYGYGWVVSRLRGLSEIMHGGVIPGFVTSLILYPSENLVVAVQDNAWGSIPGLNQFQLARDIAQFYLSSRMQPRLSPKIVTLSEQRLDGLVGRYDLGGDLLAVTRDGSHLFVRLNQWPKTEIVPTSDTEFFTKDSDDPITFVRDEKGRATKVGLRQMSMAWYEAPRLDDPAVVEVAPETLEGYTGKYDFGQGRAILTVSREGKQLYAQMKGQPKVEIFPRSAAVFFSKLIPGQITFVKDAGGKFSRLIVEQSGRKIEGPRVD